MHERFVRLLLEFGDGIARAVADHLVGHCALLTALRPARRHRYVGRDQRIDGSDKPVLVGFCAVPQLQFVFIHYFN